MRQAQLFLMVHAAAGGLLSIAESGIEDGNANLIRSHVFLDPQSLMVRVSGCEAKLIIMDYIINICFYDKLC